MPAPARGQLPSNITARADYGRSPSVRWPSGKQALVGVLPPPRFFLVEVRSILAAHRSGPPATAVNCRLVLRGQWSSGGAVCSVSAGCSFDFQRPVGFPPSTGGNLTFPRFVSKSVRTSASAMRSESFAGRFASTGHASKASARNFRGHHEITWHASRENHSRAI